MKTHTMLFRGLTAVGCLMLLLLLPGLSAAQLTPLNPENYVITTFDVPRGRDGTFGWTGLNDANDTGAIVGNWSTGGSFLLSPATPYTELVCPGAQVESTIALAINARGTSAGLCILGSHNHGFVRTRQGQWTLLTFPQAFNTEARGINDLNQVVGYYIDQAGRTHGLVWAAGFYLTLDAPFPGVRDTILSKVNNVGQVVGSYFDQTGRHPVLYDNGIWTRLTIGGNDVTPLAINDAGRLVGTLVDTAGKVRAFVYDHGTAQTLDITLPTVIRTFLAGINNRGHLIGRYDERLADGKTFGRGLLAIPKAVAAARDEGTRPKEDAMDEEDDADLPRVTGPGAPPSVTAHFAHEACPAGTRDLGTPGKRQGLLRFCAPASGHEKPAR